MNKKKQDLTELINDLGNKLVIMNLIRKIIKSSYMILSISTVTIMVIGLLYKVSNIYILAFWLLFLVFVLFFIEKIINNIEPNLKNNIKYLKEYVSSFELETDKLSTNNKSKK